IRPHVVTTRYNLLSPLYRDDETDIFDFARRHSVGVLIKQALAQGLLLDRYHPDAPPTFSAADHRSHNPQFRQDALTRLRQRLAPIRARFGSSPTELARVALRYALQHAPEAAVLVGFRSAAQIHTAVTCLGEPLREDELTAIRTALHPHTNRKA
ncbi:MAG: aldo/keto reductase, partial [Pseudonocardiaceae bacterium]